MIAAAAGRCGWLGGAALGLLLALALPPAASAHSGGTRGTDYRSRVTSTPAGVEARIIGGDDRLVLRRTGPETVTVLGYQGEPYLRLDAGGVWENRRSPAVLLNSARRPDLAAYREAEQAARGTPRWRRIAAGATAVFHDHRTHWMSSSPPLEVRADPGTSRKVFDWTVPLEVGGRTEALAGSLVYVPPPSGWWWPATLAAVGLGLAAGLVLTARLGLWPDWLAALSAVALSVVVGVAAVSELPDRGTRLLTAGALPAVVGAAVLVLALRVERAVAAFLLFLATLAIAAGVLVERLPAALGRGVVPSALSATGVRVVLVAGLACAAFTAGALLPLVFGRSSRAEAVTS